MVQEINMAEKHLQVNLSGSMYAEDAARLRSSLIEHIANGHHFIVVDLGNVDYIDCSGLGTLLHVRKQALQNDGSFIIRGLHGLVKEIFEMTLVINLFEIQ